MGGGRSMRAQNVHLREWDSATEVMWLLPGGLGQTHRTHPIPGPTSVLTRV